MLNQNKVLFQKKYKSKEVLEMSDIIRLISGTASPEFTQEIYQALQTQSVESKIIEANFGHFSDGESRVQIGETVRGFSVFVVQSTCPSKKNDINNNLMELLVAIDALRRASVEKITAVVPYHCYARQERKAAGRTPISARLVADMITTAGADRIVTMDLHAGAIEGFYGNRIPVDNLEVKLIFSAYIKQQPIDMNNIVIVSPDVGGTVRARKVAELLKAPLAVIEKRRNPGTGKAKIFNIIGDVEGKKAILVDDIIDSGKTLANGAKFLQEHGAINPWAIATHGIFSGRAMAILQDSCLEKVVVTNTIPARKKEIPKIERISVSEKFADVIRRIHEKKSVSAIFER